MPSGAIPYDCHMTSKALESLTSLGEDKDNAGGSSSAPSARPCPICGKPAIEKMRPFCSKRCADVDLHRWLGGVYAIPATEVQEDSQADTPPDEDAL
jgi:endogenous inhibitor of DNA gyrase (YacG/DUF329 family)